MQNFSEIGEVPWPRPFNITRILQSMTLKLLLRVFLRGHTVAMVTYCVKKMTTTCSPMIEQFFDTMIVASSDKERL